MIVVQNKVSSDALFCQNYDILTVKKTSHLKRLVLAVRF